MICAGGAGKKRADASDKGNIDDRAAALLFHDWDHVLHRQEAALEVHREYPVPLLFRQFHDASDMGEADVVIDDIDPSIKIRTRLDHAADVVMAGHVGGDCIGGAVFLTDDSDGLARGVLVHIGAYDLRAFAGE